MNALVSIIIPTYNRSHLLGETLESIIAQTYSHWECLVVDDGSQDYTQELIDLYRIKDERIKYFSRPNNYLKGANASRNYGIEKSRGEFLYFFDSDDLLEDVIIEKALNLFFESKELDFVFFNYKVFENNRDNYIIEQINKSSNPFIDYFKGGVNLATPSVIWRKSSTKGIKFNPRLTKSQELNYTFNIFKSNPLRGEYLNENGFYVRKHKESIMSSFWSSSERHLYSDLVVRDDIIEYFRLRSNDRIVNYQSLEVKETLRAYFKYCSIWKVFQLLLKIKSKETVITHEKIQLLFYKIVFNISKREYQFDKAISKLLAKTLVLNLSI